MNTCKNCKFWGEYRRPNVAIGDCDKIEFEPDKDLKKSFYVDVSVSDDSGLDAKLMTGEDFSCIHFEPKDKNLDVNDEGVLIQG